MECIYGKHSFELDTTTLAERLAPYRAVLVDIGTGDGQYVQHVAQKCPHTFVIGVDACRENLHVLSRKAPRNALFVIANALALPEELYGLASRITINFPWGSLLSALLEGDGALLDGLHVLAQPDAILEVRLNSSALAMAGWSLDDGARCVRHTLYVAGLEVEPLVVLDAPALRACPTSWAKRLAYGRDPRAMLLRAKLGADSASGRPLIQCRPFAVPGADSERGEGSYEVVCSG